jgi:hypothetical protein
VMNAIKAVSLEQEVDCNAGLFGICVLVNLNTNLQVYFV